MHEVTEEDLVKKRKAVEELEDQCRQETRGWKQWELQLKEEEGKTSALR